MVDLPARKAGIVACSGEELAEGTVTRLAALKVLHELRPDQTVTICLPLFLAGGEGDRTFARFHPTITVDGCSLRCAARATEMYSGKPAAGIVVTELVEELGLAKPAGCRRLNDAGRLVVEATAKRLAELVDTVLGNQGRSSVAGAAAAVPAVAAAEPGTCSCGSGVPVTKLVIDGQTIEMLVLPLIFEKFCANGRQPDAEAAQEILQAAKIYNAVPVVAEEHYRQAILREYTTFWQQEAKP